MTLQQDERTQEPDISSKDEKVEYFLIRAAELFAQKGYSECSVDELAGHLGLSKGGLYWHFSSKEELYSRICTKFCTDHQDLLQGLMQEGHRKVAYHQHIHSQGKLTFQLDQALVQQVIGLNQLFELLLALQVEVNCKVCHLILEFEI